MGSFPFFSTEKLPFSEKLTSILICFSVMTVGVIIFKYAPMAVWGGDIQFDASFHVTASVFAFYVIWYFIKQNRRWQVPFFIIATGVTVIIALERVISGDHNEIGIIMAIIISAIAIFLSRPRYFSNHLSF